MTQIKLLEWIFHTILLVLVCVRESCKSFGAETTFHHGGVGWDGQKVVFRADFSHSSPGIDVSMIELHDRRRFDNFRPNPGWLIHVSDPTLG